MIGARLRRFGRASSGATAIEFAIVAAPLLLFLTGTIEFGRLLWTREALRETAISAARCMGVLGVSCRSGGVYNSAQTLSYVQDRALAWSVVVPSSGVTLSDNATCAGVGGFSQVTISYTFATALPLFVGALKSVPLTASACFPNQS
ncbi:MAG TPA: TadE family protein [Beijerinckiaceae bacterium]|nr:TadE family protein [Beijerinckiaceae bacterium]